jgi:uncharacterized membrane protein YhhN
MLKEGANKMQQRKWLALGIFMSAALAIISAMAGENGRYLHYIFKPLTTILIFVRLLLVAMPINHAAWRAIKIAMIFSLSGDIFLMLPAPVLAAGFELGLASFLVAHLFFLVGLTRDAGLFAKPLPLVVLLLASAGNLILLWPFISAALQLPVLVYMLCLLAMAGQAASRALQLRTKASRMAAIGGIAFLVSDTLIAFNKFYTSIPAAPLLILGTYYLALYLIVVSTENEARTAPG